MGLCASEDAAVPINPERVDLSHFDMMKVVGKGGFGKVNAVQRKYGKKEILALKRMTKRKLVVKDIYMQTVWRERNIMIQLKSPFLVNVVHAFQTEHELLLVMPFMQGGDLRYFLSNSGTLDESMARFYAAEMILGMEELHSLKILYRDLKPDNVLLEADGHLRISDFGLAVQLTAEENYLASGGAGTPGYLAPEVLDEDTYGYSADIWTFGVTFYELLHKARPWGSEEEVYDLDKVYYRNDLSKEALSLIRGMLTKDISKRLGCGPDGWKAIKGHPFFNGVDWNKVARKELKPPHLPDLERANCVADYELEDQFSGDNKDPGLTPEQQKKFEGYEFNLKPVGLEDEHKHHDEKHADRHRHSNSEKKVQ